MTLGEIRKVLAAVLLQTVCTTAALAQGPDVIMVQGEGRIAVTPDIAIIQIGVESEAETADKALDQSSKKSRAIRQVIESAGIRKEDVQTTSVSLNPVIDYQSKGKQRIRAYTSRQSYSVKVRKLDTLGRLLTNVASAGANSIGDIMFTLDDNRSTLDEARTRAVTAARQKAQLLAKAAGVSLGRIISISDTDNMQHDQPMLARSAMIMDAAPGNAPSVEQGQLTVEAKIKMVFAIER